MKSNEVIARLKVLKEKGLISADQFTASCSLILNQEMRGLTAGACLPVNFSLNVELPAFKPLRISDVMARISAQNCPK